MWILFSPLLANAWNDNQASRLQSKDTGWKQKRSVREWVESWLRTKTKLWVKNKTKNNNQRVVPLLSTLPLHTSSSSSSPLPLSPLTDEAATAPSHPSVLSLINQTIRLQLQLRRRRRWATSTSSRLPPTPPPRLPRTPSKLTQINSDTQT